MDQVTLDISRDETGVVTLTHKETKILEGGQETGTETVLTLVRKK